MENTAGSYSKSQLAKVKNASKLTTINTLIQALLIALFIYAATSKLLDYNESRHQMLNQVFPKPIALILLWLVPASELIISLLICIKKTRLIGLFAYLVTMSAFTIYIILVVSGIFGRIPCSCGGAIDTLSWKAHLMLNIAVIGLTTLSIRLTKNLKQDTNRKPVSRRQADKDAAL